MTSKKDADMKVEFHLGPKAEDIAGGGEYSFEPKTPDWPIQIFPPISQSYQQMVADIHSSLERLSSPDRSSWSCNQTSGNSSMAGTPTLDHGSLPFRFSTPTELEKREGFSLKQPTVQRIVQSVPSSPYRKNSSERRVSLETTFPSKHLHMISLHNLKAKLTKYQKYMEQAFTLLKIGTEEKFIEGFDLISKVMNRAWTVPKIGHDLAYGLCDLLRESGNFDEIIHCFTHSDTPVNVQMAAGHALEECCSAQNRHYIVKNGFLKPVIHKAQALTKCWVDDIFENEERIRMSVSLIEILFKHSPETCMVLIDLNALDHIISTIKTSKNTQILRHCALALANVSMYSDTECHQKMVLRKVQDWLFLLASNQDDITRYYASLAICMLVSNKEIEAAVIKCGTLSLVEPFLMSHKPEQFAKSDHKHSQGRPQEWLQKLVPMLNASRAEAKSLAAFHFAMEAGIKKEQEKLKILEDIEAIDALKVVAASPDDVGPKYAQMALKIIGEEVPYKLSQQVPLWSTEDVKYWVKHIGFEAYAETFSSQMVDGDLLLLLTDSELEKDIGMVSRLLRKRFMRELASLKIAADYSCIDESCMDHFLMSLNPAYSIYTYQMLELGIETKSLTGLSDEILEVHCGITNPVHRLKLLEAFQNFTHIDDMEIDILSRHIEIFVSYRRSTGSQLASLIKVLLQLRGYKVFIDVDRLYAGKFDTSLLKNIRAAKHFLLVLTPHALDSCASDEKCEDWLHREVRCAMSHSKNIILIFDPGFQWPTDSSIPLDIQGITRFNGIQWVHEYQEACVDKLEKFIKGETSRRPSIIAPDHNSSPRGVVTVSSAGHLAVSRTRSIR